MAVLLTITTATSVLALVVAIVNLYRARQNLAAADHFFRARDLYRQGQGDAGDKEMAAGRAIGVRGAWPSFFDRRSV